MSAAEKLRKQLSWGAELMVYDPETEEENNVLPQIVAVVRAAEATDKRTREIEEAHELSPNELGLSLRTALDALDEELGGDELRDEGIHNAFDANQWD